LSEYTEHTIIVPYIDSIPLKSFCDIIASFNKEHPVIVTINESIIDDILIDNINEVRKTMPVHMNFGIDNCFVGNNILNYISMTEFKMVIFSEFSIRDIHLFKDRIKILNGLRVFLEQMDIPVCARNIRTEEEFQIINDLTIEYASGPFVAKTC
ncbi:MAG: EAL domain-containing protein, partial [Spirochaetota bacterium]